MKRTWIAVTAFGAAALALALANVGKGDGGGQAPGLNELTAVEKLGLRLAPLPLDLNGKDPKLVGLGSYLVNTVAGCWDCHADPAFTPPGTPDPQFEVGGDPYLGQPEKIELDGYVRGGRAFGPFLSRNLRPEIGTGLLAGRTFAQFVDIMRNGTDLDNPGQLLQVMPWPAYKNMTDTDLQAIYLYLKALPEVPPGG
jgi:hypothetical protein